MPNVACPHCAGLLENSPDLSGVLVACPRCGNQFQMPGQLALRIPLSASVFSAEPPPPPQELVIPQSVAVQPMRAPAVATRRSRLQPTKRKGDDTVNLVLGILGSTLLIGGVFMPFIRVPVLGGIDYFRNGSGDGVIVLVFGGIALVLSLCRLHVLLLFPMVAAVAVTSFTFVNFQRRVAEAKANIHEELAGNPFRGIGEAVLEGVSLDWGLFVLLIGAAMLLAAAIVPRRER